MSPNRVAEALVLCYESLKTPPESGMVDVAILCFALSKIVQAEAAIVIFLYEVKAQSFEQL